MYDEDVYVIISGNLTIKYFVAFANSITNNHEIKTNYWFKNLLEEKNL